MLSAESELTTSPSIFLEPIIALSPTKILPETNAQVNESLVITQHRFIPTELNSTSSSSASSQGNELLNNNRISTAEQIVLVSHSSANLSSSNHPSPISEKRKNNAASSAISNITLQPISVQDEGSSSDSVVFESTFGKHDMQPPLQQQETVTAQTEPPVASASKRNGLVMNIRTQTWAADSHELFDYESRNVVSNEFKCACMRDTYHIYRVGTEVHFLAGYEAKTFCACEPNAKLLAQIVWSNDGYYYLSAPSNASISTSPDNTGTDLPQEEQKLWLVVRYLRDKSVIVTAGDVLKLGRFQLQIRDALTTSQDAKDSRVCYSADDNDDCETVAPEAGDIIAQDFLPGPNTHRNVSPKKESAAAVAEEISYTKPCMSFTDSKSMPTYDSIKRFCRICLCEGNDIDEMDQRKLNPLISPCECKGSLEWVHLQCLRTWISGRLNISNDSSSFFWKSLECELCKVTYPTYVRVVSEVESNNGKLEEYTHGSEEEGSGETFSVSLNEQQSQIVSIEQVRSKQLAFKQFELVRRQSYSIELFEFPRPDVPYVILEPKTNQADRGFHVVGLANNRVARLGRGHESDVRIADISVSRLHSVLRYQPVGNMKRHMNALVGSSGYGAPNLFNAATHGCFLIQDHNSKFGTLLELQQPFRLDISFPGVSIQAGRTIITISLRRRWRLRMPACILQKQHALSSDIYVLFRQPQQVSSRDKNLFNSEVQQHHES